MSFTFDSCLSWAKLDNKSKTKIDNVGSKLPLIPEELSFINLIRRELMSVVNVFMWNGYFHSGRIGSLLVQHYAISNVTLYAVQKGTPGPGEIKDKILYCLSNDSAVHHQPIIQCSSY